jgi:CubicO group peptidase (beta-lactamase class C family)
VLPLIALLLPTSAAPDLDAVVRGYFETDRFEGVVLVAKGDKVLLHKAYGFADRAWETPLTPDARFPLCHLTEQFTAALALMLVDDGKLGLDQSLADFWPDLAGKPAAEVKVAHLLGRRSGLRDVDLLGSDVSPDVAVVERDVPWIWRTRDPRVRSMEGIAQLVLSQPPTIPPGMPQRNNSDYIVLGAIIEKVAAQPYTDLVTERILKPLGLTETGFLDSTMFVPKLARSALKRTDGWYAGPGVRWENAPALLGLYGTAKDVLKWNLALLDGKVLSEKGRALFFGPAPGEFRNGFGGDWGEIDFGQGRKQILDCIGAIAAYRAHSSIVVPERLSVIFLSGNSAYNPKPVHREANITYELAVEALSGGERG